MDNRYRYKGNHPPDLLLIIAIIALVVGTFFSVSAQFQKRYFLFELRKISDTLGDSSRPGYGDGKFDKNDEKEALKALGSKKSSLDKVNIYSASRFVIKAKGNIKSFIKYFFLSILAVILVIIFIAALLFVFFCIISFIEGHYFKKRKGLETPKTTKKPLVIEIIDGFVSIMIIILIIGGAVAISYGFGLVANLGLIIATYGLSILF
jgi:hypothetical protein